MRFFELKFFEIIGELGTRLVLAIRVVGWATVEEYGVSSHICRLLKTLYVVTQASVRVEGELTDWFEVKCGLRQGCLLSPGLFNVFMDRVVRRSLAEE